MASLRKKDRSPFWFACFTLPDGRRTQRSTGTTDKRQAQRIGNEFEDAAHQGTQGRFIESRARKTIADIYALANTDTLPGSTVSNFMDSWLKRKELEAGEKTHARYSTVAAQFTGHLGAKAGRDIANVTAADITKFRDALAKRVTVGTVNVSMKILRSAFAQARRDGMIDVNEAERVTLLKRKDRFERRPFSMPELKRILEVAKDEWRGMILFGLYTGQRLSDLANLTWQNVDLQRAELRLVTGKTGRRQIIPLAEPLLNYIAELPAGDKPDAPLFPKIHATAQRHKHAGNLSNEFFGILVAAGLAQKKSHHADPDKKKGRSAKREQNEISFHSLRHTATSLLKSAGVSDAVAMEFIGHDSKSVSRQYTHIP
ncbi:MAG: site-specific integrase, partial [Verrucomicrobiia bacterium]